MCNTHTLPRTLKQFYLTSNQLKKIPNFCLSNGSSRVPSLETLNLDKNLIESIQNVSVYCLNALSVMSLEDNFIKTVASNFLPRNLKELTFKSNFIHNIPDFCSSNGTSYFPYLRKLVLENNHISQLNNRSFACLPSLNTLHLGRNSLVRIGPNTFRSLTQLKYLDLSDLKPGDSSDYLDYFPFPLVEEDSFDNPSLKYFNFSHNRIFPNISKLPQLEEFDLSNCIESLTLNSPFVKTKIGRQPNLKVLNLTNCKWSRIQSWFFKSFSNLEKVFLSKNFITKVNKILFLNNPKIKAVFLDANCIRHIGPNTFPIAYWNNTHLDLSGNPFACDCNLLWFRNKLNKSLSKNIKQCALDRSKCYLRPRRLYQCNSPPERVGLQISNLNVIAEECKQQELKSELFIVLSSCLSIVAVVTISALVAYKGRWHIRYWIYLLRYKRKINMPLEDADFVYDAFVIYTDEDRDFVHNTLLPKLEDEEQLSLCVHCRDFEPGKIISDNIVECMGNSRKAIFILSKYFCQSRWCKFELTIAQDRWLNHESDALLTTMLEEIQSEHMTKELRALIRTTTYAMWTDDNQGQRLFWNKILHTLRRQM